MANGDKYRPFQVHSLDTVGLLKPVCKCVLAVSKVEQISEALRQAFATAVSGEPGPVAVVIPFNLLIEMTDGGVCAPAEMPASLPCDAPTGVSIANRPCGPRI